MKLCKREKVALDEIAKYPKTPSGGYSIWWTPKTNKKLESKGLVEIVRDRVYVTDAGLDFLTKP